MTPNSAPGLTTCWVDQEGELHSIQRGGLLATPTGQPATPGQRCPHRDSR